MYLSGYMGSERPDMFDVASGECELVDFLLTRFDPIDLKTKIKFDPSAQVDEQLAPPKEVEAAPLVPDKPEPERVALQLDLKMPPPPRSQVDSTDPNDGFRPAANVPEADGSDQLETSGQEEEQAVLEEVPDSTPMGPDWLTLHQRFQEAAQRYQEEKLPPSDGKVDASP